ncbi:MAG TPA: hypothetical protein VEL74_19855 [Thermoanaerobaculia bacterium]|nr:hypothetical protein [Thermoanaerobaculia bacterium]
MRRTSLWLLPLAFLALPLLAQPQSPPLSCGAKFLGPLSAEGLLDAGTYQPLAAEQRLYYGLTGLGDEALEIRYLVADELYLTENLDLSTSRLPRAEIPGRKPLRQAESTLDFQELLEGEWMVELLALRPDLVRRLHELAQQGSRIEVQVFQAGRRLAALPFKGILRRSTELGASGAVQVVVHSTVRGIGERAEPRNPPLLGTKVLASCSECLDEMPCDTECGYDPGKGGPVTCGENGAPCGGSTCECSRVLYDSWTSWYFNRAYAYSPATYDCLKSGSSFYTTHQVYILEYRRDLVRSSMICPNCPSCVGCYFHQQVIDYQLTTSYCYYNVGGGCGFGRTAACYELCSMTSYCN